MADSRQILNQDAILQLSATNPTELDNIVRSVNSEVTPSLRIRITGSLQLTIDPLLVVNAETTRIHSIPPINNLLPFTFTGDIIAVPSSNNSNITHSAGASLLLNITSGHYVRLGMSINSLGTVFLTLGTSSATKNLATAPAIPSNTFGIGHVILQNIGGTIQTITEVIQYSGGGGGSGTGDANTFLETLKNQLNDSVYEFVTPNIISVDAQTKVDATPTTATYNLVDNSYQFTKTAGTDWTTRSKTGTGIGFGGTWSPELGLFVITGQDAAANNIYTSPDGITWTTQSKGNTYSLRGVAWSPELNLFAAVATDTATDNIFTSPDGITWTTQSKGNTAALSGITWSPELGLFVAVAPVVNLSNIYTSPDGITWTVRTKGNNYILSEITWAPELGLLVAVSGNTATDNIYTSPDGITWTTRSKANTKELNNIAWSPELRLLVATALVTATDNIFTSPDGTTWTARTKGNNYILQDVTWASELGLFVAVASATATDNIYTSPNGTTWTTRSKANNYGLRTAMWSPERGVLIAVGVVAATDNIFTSSGDFLYSTQSLDPDFLDEGRDVGSVQLLVKMRTGYVPSTLLASVSRDGGNVYQKIEMERIGASDSFVGTHAMWEEYRDQTLFSQTSTNSTTQFGINDIEAYGQKIVITNATVAKSIRIRMFRVGLPDGVVFASLVRGTTAGTTPSLLTSDILATSNSVVINTIGTSDEDVDFTFPDTVLAPGTYYAIFQTSAAYKGTWVLDTKTLKIDTQSSGSSGYTEYNDVSLTWSTASASAALLYYLFGRVLDMRVMISSPVSATEMSAYGILYDLQTTGFTNSSKLIQRFDFNSTVDNLNEFTLTAFTPDPDLLTVYYIQGGQAFRYGAFSLNGHKIVFPVNSFNNGGVSQAMTVVAVQNEGSSFDNSDKNGLLLASNHLSSTDPSISKGIPGHGIMLMRPDGIIREIALDNLDNIVIYSV